MLSIKTMTIGHFVGIMERKMQICIFHPQIEFIGTIIVKFKRKFQDALFYHFHV